MRPRTSSPQPPARCWSKMSRPRTANGKDLRGLTLARPSAGAHALALLAASRWLASDERQAGAPAHSDGPKGYRCRSAWRACIDGWDPGCACAASERRVGREARTRRAHRSGLPGGQAVRAAAGAGPRNGSGLGRTFLLAPAVRRRDRRPEATSLERYGEGREWPPLIVLAPDIAARRLRTIVLAAGKNTARSLRLRPRGAEGLRPELIAHAARRRDRRAGARRYRRHRRATESWLRFLGVATSRWLVIMPSVSLSVCLIAPDTASRIARYDPSTILAP